MINSHVRLVQSDPRKEARKVVREASKKVRDASYALDLRRRAANHGLRFSTKDRWNAIGEVIRRGIKSPAGNPECHFREEKNSQSSQRKLGKA